MESHQAARRALSAIRLRRSVRLLNTSRQSVHTAAETLIRIGPLVSLHIKDQPHRPDLPSLLPAPVARPRRHLVRAIPEVGERVHGVADIDLRVGVVQVVEAGA